MRSTVTERLQADRRKVEVLGRVMRDVVQVLPARFTKLDGPSIRPHEGTLLVQDTDGSQFVIAVRPVG